MRVCKSVQEALPRASTSGGQSDAASGVDVAERDGGDDALLVLGVGCSLGWYFGGLLVVNVVFIMDFHAAEDVHVLQLGNLSLDDHIN